MPPKRSTAAAIAASTCASSRMSVGDRERLAAGCFDIGGRRVDRAGQFRMRLGGLRGDDDVGAVGGGAHRDRVTDPSRRASDEDRARVRRHDPQITRTRMPEAPRTEDRMREICEICGRIYWRAMSARDVIANLRELAAAPPRRRRAAARVGTGLARRARSGSTASSRDRSRAVARRRRQQLGDAPRRVRPHRDHRRPSRFGAERRLARRRARRAGRLRSAAAVQGPAAAGHADAGRLGRRRRRAIRAQPARIVGGERQPEGGRGARARRQDRARGWSTRCARTASRSIACSTRIDAEGDRRAARISSCTSSRGRCSRR